LNRVHATLVGLGLSIYAPLGFLFPLDIILPVLPPSLCETVRAKRFLVSGM
jgi:hypothetical protein